MTKSLITATIALILGITGTALAQTLPIRVTVYGTHEGSNIVYHYKVINNGDVPLHEFVIGSAVNDKNPDGYPQLDRRPLGWGYGQEGETGTEILLAPTSTTQPPNWAASMCGKQEFSYHCLEWSVTAEGQAYVIPAGQSLAGFSISVALVDNKQFPHKYYKATYVNHEYYKAGQVANRDEDMYLRSGFKTSYWNAQKNDIQNIWGLLEIEDTIAPTLSVTLTPNILRQNEKFVPVAATITVKDDYDPQPEINLVSITCNEPMDKDDIKVGKLFTDIRQFQLKADHDGKSHAGRVYTVTYIAIDGSGNQTMASATVTVPHERKEHDDRRDEKDKKNDKDEHKRDR